MVTQANNGKKIESAEELGENLIRDLKENKKKDLEITSSINSLGNETFVNTMRYINNFLSDEIK